MTTRSVAIVALLTFAGAAQATTQVSADFSTYTPGNLVGQNGWVQQGASALAPLQVTGGTVAIPGIPAATGNPDNQDARIQFSSNIPATVGASAYLGATITVNNVFAPSTSVGASFILALSTTDASPFQNLRVTTRTGTAPGTFQFGVRATGQAGNPPFWTTDLALGTTYNIIVAWNFNGGNGLDTIAGYLNPAATIGASTAWGSATVGTGAAPGFQSLIVSQFSSGTTSQSSVNIGRLIVADTFAEAAAFVPTPGTAGVLALAGLAAGRRRR
jgi:hypothetical protein